MPCVRCCDYPNTKSGRLSRARAPAPTDMETADAFPTKVLVLADVHHRTAVADLILAAEEPFTRAVFLGDLFDEFGDGPAEARATARWLKAKLAVDPRLVFLFGNHDLPYAFPAHPALWCPGFTKPKAAAVAEVLGAEHWERFRLCHVEGSWLLSHAGFHPSMLPRPGPPDWQKIAEAEAAAALRAVASPWRRHGEEPPPALLAWGKDRGGEAPVGGATWLDWSGLKPIAGVHQIVGHTPVRGGAAAPSRRRRLLLAHLLPGRQHHGYLRGDRPRRHGCPQTLARGWAGTAPAGCWLPFGSFERLPVSAGRSLLLGLAQFWQDSTFHRETA